MLVTLVEKMVDFFNTCSHRSTILEIKLKSGHVQVCVYLRHNETMVTVTFDHNQADYQFSDIKRVKTVMADV